ncbi:MAG: hypothetical protein ACP5SD_00470 [Elusimicrobiales bacterium]
MKKITLILLSCVFSYSLLSAQTYAQELNNTGKIKKGGIETKKEEVKEKSMEKLHTLTGVVKSVDVEKKTITVDSVKKKGETMTFGYEGLKLKDGKDMIDASSLKVGDKIKIRYTGDITAPKIEKMMMWKEEIKGKLDKKEKSSEVKPVENKPVETKPQNVVPQQPNPSETKQPETKPAEVKQEESKPVTTEIKNN